MSNTYVKKYDVGQINLDLPYANYIHELPLLSFGDVQHTINLSLVFNYARKAEGDNSFNIANGFKLNMQKRIIKDTSTNLPIEFQDERGKIVVLTNNGNGIYTFKDDSQKILRVVNDGYELEYSDLSKETFSGNGYITGVYSKYDTDKSFLTYGYTSNRLTSITYGETKTITLGYENNRLESIGYAGCNYVLHYNNDGVYKIINRVENNSEVSYIFDFSNGFVVRAMDADANTNSNAINSVSATIDSSTPKITVTNHYGESVVYEFSNSTSSNSTVTITDNNGVKTRVQYEGNKPLYSYEIEGDDAQFTANNTSGQFLGNVRLYNTVGVPTNNKATGMQTINDGMKLGDSNGNGEWSVNVTTDKYGYYTLSGWVKHNNNSTTSPTIQIFSRYIDPDLENEPTEPYIQSFCVSLNQNNKWTYFSYVFYADNTTINIVPDNNSSLSWCDLRLTHLGSDKSHLNMSEYFLLNGSDEISFNHNDFYCSVNGVDTNVSGVTFADLMKYKLSKRNNGSCNEVYYNNCREVFANAQNLRVAYNDNLVNINNFDLGVRTYSNKKEYLTRIHIDENNPNNEIIKTVTVGDTVISREILDNNLDVISSTVDGVTTNYTRDANGLVTSESVSGLYRHDTTYTDSLITVTDLEPSTESVISTTKHYLNTTWGGVEKTEILDSNNVIKSSITNTYDGDMSVLTGKAFGNRANSFGYSNGKLQLMTNGALDYTFEYSTKDELEQISKNTASIEHHTYTTIEGNKTQVESKYPSESAIYTEKTIFDKYDRLESVDGVFSNTYNIWPTFENNGALRDANYNNGSALLAMTTDLLRGETSRYKYNRKNELEEKTVTDKDDYSEKISKETFEYDDIGRLTRDHCIYNQTANNSVTSGIQYVKNASDPNADNRISRYSYYLNGASSPIAQTGTYYDDFKRLTTKFCAIDGKEFAKHITYDKTRPRQLLEMLNGRPLSNINYEYDVMGRISAINDVDYTYDAYGQLIEEKNNTLDKTIEYEYNTNTGNLESVTTRKGSGTPTTTTFGYDNDRLTSLGGKAITYNANGGVASYNGWNYTWNKGKLSSIGKNLGGSSRAIITPILGPNKTYSFSYNGLGQRVRQSYSHFWLEGDIISVHQGETTAYTKDYTYDHSGRLICEDISKTLYLEGTESSKIVYLYDESGIVGMQYSNDTTATTNTYYFLRNLQGDVIAIYDTNGAEIASYSYDAWGNCTINSTTTNYSVAHANPIRYRGYYYDEDTKLYYLNSRYYSPEFRRFISPDDTAYLDPETPNGLNLYCYCNNDPVNYSDGSGHNPEWNWETFFKGLTLVGVAISAIVVSVSTFGLATPLAMTIVASVTLGAGILTGINGFATMIESGTDYNFVRDGVFNEVLGLSDTAYNWYAGITAGVAIIGTSICTIWNITNPIKGFTDHGRQSALSHDGHGVNARAMQNAVRNPLEVANQSNGGIKHIGKNAVVVLNKAGKVITTYAKNHYGWRRF